MLPPIRFSFSTHGLGDVVHCCTAMRLYVDRGYDVALQVEPNKRWVFEAAGIPLYDGHESLPIHPYHYLPSINAFWDLSLPDHSSSKIAGFFDIKELPRLGSKEDVWRRVCSERIDGAKALSLESLAKAARLIEDLPKPVILLHSKGTNWQAEKSIPDGTTFALICELVATCQGSVVTLDWDSRSPTLDHPRVRPAGRITTEVFGALCQLSDLMIGVDSGPFHLAQWFDIPTLFVTRKIPPVRCCLPSPRARYLVPAAEHHWLARGPEWTFCEFTGQEASVKDIMVTALDMLATPPNSRPADPMLHADDVPGEYTYHRVGHDQRRMVLDDHGHIREGAADCERTWQVETLPIGQVLTISDGGGNPTCHLKRDSDGTFRGRWLRHEQMPIELVPLAIPVPETVTWGDLVPQDPLPKAPDVSFRKHEYGYTSLETFKQQCIAFARTLPPVKAIAGVPRSGLLAASLVALELNVPMLPLESLLGGKLPDVPPLRRTKREAYTGQGLYLVIDDTCASGRKIDSLRPRLHPGVKIGVIQGSEHADYFGVRFDLELHQSFEWTLLHDDNAEFTLCDLDGVLCEDWIGDEEAEPERYAEHVRNAKPQRIPSYPLLAVVTNRLAQYQLETARWLARHGIEYQHLMVSASRTVQERSAKAWNYKADVYMSLDKARLFIESSSREARDIKRITSRPVFSVEDNALIWI